MANGPIEKAQNILDEIVDEYGRAFAINFMEKLVEKLKAHKALDEYRYKK